jgi:hypothetical protein
MKVIPERKHDAIQAYGGIEFLPFVICAIDGGEWSASRPCLFASIVRLCEDGCVSESVRTIWRREKCLAPEMES